MKLTACLKYILICFLLLIFCNSNLFSENNKKDDKKLKELQVKLAELNSSLMAEMKPEKSGDKNNKSAEKSDTATTQETAVTGNSGNNSPDGKKDEAITNNIKKDNIKEQKIENKTDEEKKISDKEYENEKKKTDWIIRTIDNGTHKERKRAINYILTVKNDSLKQKLGEKLLSVIRDETETEVKVKAITVAGEIRLKEAVPALIAALNDEFNDVVIAAIYSIKKINDQGAKQPLIDKFKAQKLETHSLVTEALIDTLSEFKAAELMDYAIEAIKNLNTHQNIRELLVLFLGKIESKESKDILIELLSDEDENMQVRAFAANSLANLKITESIDAIENVIQAIESYNFNKKRQYNNLYMYCIAALAKFGDEKALPRLINALRSDNALVRLKAVQLIKGIDDKRTIDILKYKMNYDTSPKVQNAAKEALKELGVEVDDKKIPGKADEFRDAEEPEDKTETNLPDEE